jgi:hypothetical protein
MITNRTKKRSQERHWTWSPAASFLLLAAVTLCGCTKFSLQDSFRLFEKEAKPEVPERMVAVWTYSIMNRAGQPSTRGFGGRVTFFGADDKASILVDGQLTVYAFDDDCENLENSVPEKKFIFPRANLASHQSESNLGPSYSFWLPWDEVNGPHRRLSLIGRFDDASGKVILSQSASVSLPGKSDPTKLTVTKSPPTALHRTGFPVQQASHESEDAAATNGDRQDDAPQRSRMQTTTIPLTPAFANRLGVSGETPTKPTGEAQRPTTKPAVNADRQLPGNSSAPLPEPPAPDPGLPPSARSQHGESPVRNLAARRPSDDPVRRQPFRGEWPRHLPPTPRTGWDRGPAD